ncbi:MAG: hypothetical protein H7A03_11755 [Pseudomonadales bacterium]|nr:hypothetical protein [Pseudomonadales bacterium]
MNDSQVNETKTPEAIVGDITLTATILPTNTPSLPSPTYTIPAITTPTAVPDTPTPTAIPPTATPKPLPTATLTSEQIDANLTELMLTNGGCELPCLWGIVPGKTSTESAREGLTALGASFVDSTYASFFGIGWGAAIEFEISNDIVQTMNMGGSYASSRMDRDKYTQGWQPYSLTAVLDHYGLPTRVLVYKPFQADPGQPSYHLLVFYEDSGIQIDYRGSVEILSDDHYYACPDMSDIWDVHLFLYQPGEVDNVVERILPASGVSYIADSETVHDVISWPQATGTSLESFYETFRMPEANACFEFVTP